MPRHWRLAVFVSGEVSFWSKVDFDGPVPARKPDLGPCWIWRGSVKDTGYGSYRPVFAFDVEQRTFQAHRFAYLYVFDFLPEGEADHLCRNTACMNPFHLEFVTHQVNVLRGETIVARAAATTQCPKGHAYDLINTHIKVNGARGCRACDRQRAHERRQHRSGSVRCIDCHRVVGKGPRCRRCGAVLRESLRKVGAR